VSVGVGRVNQFGVGMSITRVSSTFPSAPPSIARSSAVRAGDLVVLSGIDAGSGDGVVAAGDPYIQTKTCLAKMVAVLSELGASVSDVIQTRMLLTDADAWPAVARAHREVFEHARPAASIVVVRLLDPRMLVELEVMAYVEGVLRGSL
jgi:enamine deaminase RidA (YjgF/YER057c/UK114 family)